MVGNILPADLLTLRPLTLGMGSIGQRSTFSEPGHVAYQIKGNHKCTYKVANTLPADSPNPLPPPWRCGQ